MRVEPGVDVSQATSEWTLDYPPLFAWFEWTLAQVARFFDENMLSVSSLNYLSARTLLFQRLSVIVTDAVLILAAYLFSNRFSVRGEPLSDAQRSFMFSLIVLNPGLLIVDRTRPALSTKRNVALDVHFQYNGIMMGLLLLACYAFVTVLVSVVSMPNRVCRIALCWAQCCSRSC